MPQNVWSVGWYREGPVPGASGDSVIDGHSGLPGQPLVFANLGRLRPGAQITVTGTGGTRTDFVVRGLTSWPAGSHPPGLFATGGPARLSLITCTGPFNGGSQRYADRLIVEATLASAGD